MMSWSDTGHLHDGDDEAQSVAKIALSSMSIANGQKSPRSDHHPMRGPERSLNWRVGELPDACVMSRSINGTTTKAFSSSWTPRSRRLFTTSNVATPVTTAATESVMHEASIVRKYPIQPTTVLIFRVVLLHPTVRIYSFETDPIGEFQTTSPASTPRCLRGSWSFLGGGRLHCSPSTRRGSPCRWCGRPPVA